MEIEDIDLKQVIEDTTGQRFNKANFIHSPFNSADKNPSFSIKFDKNKNKWIWKDFSTDKGGDAIDFIREYYGCDYKAARERLGIPLEKTEAETEQEKLLGYINWSLENQEFRKGQKLIGLFRFEDEKNKTLYYKAKFLKPDGKKDMTYFSFNDEGKVINKRNHDEVPYNLYNTLTAINEGKIIIIVEGESDANTLNGILPKTKYCATSIKGIKQNDKDNKYIQMMYAFGMQVYMIPDTGDKQNSAEHYKWLVRNFFQHKAKVFKIINLPYINRLGHNKDVNDWLDAGHTKKELLEAFSRSLDLNDEHQLQQSKNGIWKAIFKKDKDGCEYKAKDMQLTDFQIIQAKRIIYETGEEGVSLKLKSSTGSTIEREGQVQVFDDTKSFKNFLGTLDLSFLGKAEEATQLKQWINYYWTIENEECFLGTKFIRRNDKNILIASDGAISNSGYEYGLKSDNSSLEILDKEEITKAELKEISCHLFKFASKDKTIPIIGTVINNLMVNTCIENKIFLHHLLLVGESGSGKSAILNNIIVPLLNLKMEDVKSIGETTNAAIQKLESEGNYPIIFDEYKPSTFGDYKKQFLSNFLRNVYSRNAAEKGNKDMTNRKYAKNRPWILAGEESYSSNEKANIERSCIVYLSKNERDQEQTDNFKWLEKNEELIRKLGFSLIKTVLSIEDEEYLQIRKNVEDKLNNVFRAIHNANKDFKALEDRPLNTAINICSGIEIFNKLLASNGLKAFEHYETFVVLNIAEEVLEDGQETHSVVEQMLLLFDNMMQDERVRDTNSFIIENKGKLYIRTTEMLNQIFMYLKYNDSSDIVPLKLKDFKKQATKAGYILGNSTVYCSTSAKTIRAEIFNKDMLEKLGCNSILKLDIGRQNRII